MRFTLKNIQAFEDVTYDFGDKGISIITGNNSNGKSILFKVVEAIVTLKIKDAESRIPFIRDGYDFGSVAMERDNGLILACRIGTTTTDTVLALATPVEGGEPKMVSRTLREGGWEELIYDFGWRVDASTQSCLQIQPTYGVMPGVNTTPAQTYNIIKPWITDSVAERFVQNYADVTYPKFKDAVTNLKERASVLERQCHAVTVRDSSKMSLARAEMQRIYLAYRGIDKFELKRLRIPPSVQVMDISAPKLNKIMFTKVLEPAPTLESLLESVEKMASLKAGVCPTCGKPLVEGGVCDAC